MKTMLVMFIAMCLAVGVSAQEVPDATLMSMRAEVSIEGAGGTLLAGDFYAADMNAPTPVVMLMHMFGRNRGDWQPFIDPLLNAGYSVLAVDLRGHGESEGTRDWVAAQTDVSLWIDWMNTQPFIDAERIVLVGGSIGANLALVGCAADERCDSAVALSPGLDYFGVMTEPAMDGLADRSALLVAAHLDAPSGNDVIELVSAAQGEVGLHLYSGRGHGTDLFEDTQSGAADTLIPLMLLWLDGHVGGRAIEQSVDDACGCIRSNLTPSPSPKERGEKPCLPGVIWGIKSDKHLFQYVHASSLHPTMICY